MPAPDAAPLPLRFEGVGLTRGGAALLSDVSFRVDPGPISVVLGPNGSGKTLLLRLANGLLEPTAGSVRWAVPAAAALRDVSLVFQRPVLLRRTARANVAYPARVRGLPRAERARRTVRALEMTRLSELAERPARLLSVGEQQRLALARAWVLEPRVLFLDEPAAALDPGSTGALEATITALRDAGTKIVMTTHDLGQARRLAGEVLFLHRGRLLEQTPADAFFAGPKSVEARKFVEGELVP